MSPLIVDLIKKLFFYLFCKKGKAKKLLILNKVFYQNKLNQTVKVLGTFETLFTKRGLSE